MGNTRKMVNIAIDETSGVDHPAHLTEGWLIMKSADSSDVQRVLDATLTEEESDMSETTTTATEESIDELAIAKARITELEEQVAKASAPAEAPTKGGKKKVAPAEGSTEEEKAETADEKKDETAQEYMKSAPAVVVEMLESITKSRDEAVTELRKEREAKADAEAIAKAKGWANLNLDAEKFGPAFRQLSEISPELAKSIESTLSSLNEQAESANIFAELGKSANGSGDAIDQLESMAKALVATGVAKSEADAISQVAQANPELYTAYRNEKKG